MTLASFGLQILKQDWPHRWPSFIPDIVNASKLDPTLCENTMTILKLLSEEVREQMICACAGEVCQTVFSGHALTQSITSWW